MPDSIMFAGVFIGLPIFVLGNLLYSSPKGLNTFLISLASGLLALVLVFQTFRWDIPGVWSRPVALALFIALAVFLLVRHHRAEIVRIWQEAGIRRFRLLLPLAALPVGLAAGGAFVTPPERSIALAPPIPGRTVYVSAGGGVRLINHHLRVNAQRYALDLTVLGEGGRRARGLMPEALGDYHIHGAEVVAPCAGEVVVLDDGHPEQAIGEKDSANPGGNFAAIACEGVTVVLAHLQAGLPVTLGQTLAVGDRVGLAGNSGNTTEPHLHIHAVEGRVTDPHALLRAGPGIALSFDGVVPRRNDILPPVR